MISLREYLGFIDDYEDKISSLINNTVNSNKGVLLSYIKLRLYRYGVDSEGNTLGEYSLKTKKYKKSVGQVLNHVTLRDSGDWYSDMFVKAENLSIFINNDNWKNDLLTEIYGENILNLSEREVVQFIDEYIEPLINEFYRKLDRDIDLDIEL